MTAFNVGCIDEVDTFSLEKILIADGQNHPLDKKIRSMSLKNLIILLLKTVI